MKIDKHSAAVDTDFINHVAEINQPGANVAKLLDAVLSGVNLSAIVHPLVYKYEVLADDPKVRVFFEKGIIAQPTFEDILQGNAEREGYYKYLIPELYNILHANDPLPEGIDVLTYWMRRKSLGEIHSVAMCLVCGCGIFLSDDGDSKILSRTIQQRSLGEIQVYNRKEILDISQEDADPKLPKGDRKAFAHIVKPEKVF